MPTPWVYLTIGQTCGNINTAGIHRRDSVGKYLRAVGHEDEMLVQEFPHNVTAPNRSTQKSAAERPARSHKPPAVHFTVALEQPCRCCTNAPCPVKCCRKPNCTGGVLPLKASRSICLHHPARRTNDCGYATAYAALSGLRQREFTQLLEVWSTGKIEWGTRQISAPLARMTGAPLEA